MEQKKKETKIVVIKKGKLIVAGILILTLIVLVSVIFMKGYSSATDKYKEEIKRLEEEIKSLSDPVVQYEVASKEVSIDLIESEIHGIGELATIEYLYTDAGKYEDIKQLLGINVPFTTKSFIVKWDGIIKAGIKVEQVETEIDHKQKEILIHMPEAEILSHEIDEDSIETLDERNGLFNPVKVEDVRAFDAISKDAMEERAIENGLLDKAYDNAKSIIEKIVNNEVVQEQGYSVVFEEIE